MIVLSNLNEIPNTYEQFNKQHFTPYRKQISYTDHTVFNILGLGTYIMPISSILLAHSQS